MIIRPGTNIEELSIEERIGLVRSSGGYLIELLRCCVIEDDLIGYSLNLNDLGDLRSLKNLTYIPDNLEVRSYLDLSNCINLKEIGRGLRVRRWLSLENCSSLEVLPKDLEVGGNLYLSGCDSLREVPKNIKVRSEIYLLKHLKG